jgi:hypothetical protein
MVSLFRIEWQAAIVDSGNAGLNHFTKNIYFHGVRNEIIIADEYRDGFINITPAAHRW